YTATEVAAVRAGLVADPVLEVNLLRLAAEVGLERRLERHDIVGMDTVDPVLRATDAGGRGQPYHRLPSAREVELLAAKIPFPQAVIRAVSREREPLGAAPEREFRARVFRDVMPEHGRAADNGQDFYLQNPRTRGSRQRNIRERLRGPGVERIVD